MYEVTAIVKGYGTHDYYEVWYGDYPTRFRAIRAVERATGIWLDPERSLYVRAPFVVGFKVKEITDD